MITDYYAYYLIGVKVNRNNRTNTRTINFFLFRFSVIMITQKPKFRVAE